MPNVLFIKDYILSYNKYAEDKMIFLVNFNQTQNISVDNVRIVACW